MANAPAEPKPSTEPKFLLRILSLKGLVFEGEVEAVYCHSTDGEFEMLAYHYPLMAALSESEIKIAYMDPIKIRVGIVMFKNNICIIICELDPSHKELQRSWDVEV